MQRLEIKTDVINIVSKIGRELQSGKKTKQQGYGESWCVSAIVTFKCESSGRLHLQSLTITKQKLYFRPCSFTC